MTYSHVCLRNSLDGAVLVDVLLRDQNVPTIMNFGRSKYSKIGAKELTHHKCSRYWYVLVIARSEWRSMVNFKVHQVQSPGLHPKGVKHGAALSQHWGLQKGHSKTYALSWQFLGGAGAPFRSLEALEHSNDKVDRSRNIMRRVPAKGKPRQNSPRPIWSVGDTRTRLCWSC
jgi:hypothetical protein